MNEIMNEIMNEELIMKYADGIKTILTQANFNLNINEKEALKGFINSDVENILTKLNTLSFR